LIEQVLERPLMPGEDSLDDLERAFRATPVDAPKIKQKPAIEELPAEPMESGKPGSQSIRVSVDTLERLMTMVSELVLTRNQLLEIVRRHEDSEFKTPLQRLSNVTAELQEGVMKTRMQPIGGAWQKLPRIVRDLSLELGKQIELEMQGADTELDRQVLELIKDPLTHMIRNSADHGLENPAERKAAGKPERGRIRLYAWHEGGFIIVQVSDDGRGLDSERIRAKALAQGLATEAELAKLTEAQLHKFIFVPGFSTATKITSISGRGVGMDVVRNNIDQIGGTIDVRSVPGVGVSFTVKIPLTLAIVSALIVQAGGSRFAIPQLAVLELVRARNGGEHRIERIGDTAVLRLRAARAARRAARDRHRDADRQRLRGRDAGRKPAAGRRCRCGLPHGRNRGEADVVEAAPYPDVLRQHHPRRRLGHHDPRSERDRARARHHGRCAIAGGIASISVH
jgi:two-component system chemotaxis sensor kinase CheA